MVNKSREHTKIIEVLCYGATHWIHSHTPWPATKWFARRRLYGRFLILGKTNTNLRTCNILLISTKTHAFVLSVFFALEYFL